MSRHDPLDWLDKPEMGEPPPAPRPSNPPALVGRGGQEAPAGPPPAPPAGTSELPDPQRLWLAVVGRLEGQLPADVLAGCQSAVATWAGPFDGWTLRPDRAGRLGWEAPSGPAEARWWGRCDFDALPTTPRELARAWVRLNPKRKG